MAKDKKIHLPDLPQDEYYEDLVAALLCAGGYYIEKRIDLREPTKETSKERASGFYRAKALHTYQITAT